MRKYKRIKNQAVPILYKKDVIHTGNASPARKDIKKEETAMTPNETRAMRPIVFGGIAIQI
jgi:hypothetical protein